MSRALECGWCQGNSQGAMIFVAPNVNREQPDWRWADDGTIEFILRYMNYRSRVATTERRF